MNQERNQRLQGLLWGIPIGDALGMAVETFQADRITAEYGRVTTYLAPTGHKWFNGELAGTTTDDWQLSEAVGEALLESGLDLECHGRWHVKAMNESTKGWGGTTRVAVRNVANGMDWLNSGVSGPGKGKGNGPPMKVGPLAGAVGVYSLRDVFDFTAKLTLMTHPTELAVSSAFTQLTAIYYCLRKEPKDFDPEEFISHLVRAAKAGERFGRQYMDLPPEDDKLAVELLRLTSYKEWSTGRAIAEFGRGSCYCFHSLPFTYYFFLRNPQSIESLYDVVSAGGDTDTNGSMLAALLGALHGPGIFPDELKLGLVQRERVLNFMARFIEKFA